MKPRPQSKTLVDKELDRLFSDLRDHDVDSEKYAAILDRIVKLHKLQAEEKPKQVSPDTLVLAGTNILGILIILKFEQLNIITTKAMSFVQKPR